MITSNYETDLKIYLSNESQPTGSKLIKLNNFLKIAQESLFASGVDEKDAFLNSIPNYDYIGRKTKLEVANVLRRPWVIFDIWKCADNTLLPRSFQFSWIFTDSKASPLISDVDFITNNLFPQLSISCRKKVVTKLGKFCLPKDAPQVTKIYKKLTVVYGIKLAKHLLPACSPQLIDSLIVGRQIILDDNQLLTIYQKYPSLGIEYLKSFYQDIQEGKTFFTLKNSCPTSLKHLAHCNPGEFISLFDTYKDLISTIPQLKLGSNLTFHLIKQDTGKIIYNAGEYAKILCHKEVKKLNDEEFQLFFNKLFPENIQNFGLQLQSLVTWLDKYPAEIRFTKLANGFQYVYKQDIMDLECLAFFPDNPEKLIPMLSPYQRDKWVDMKLSQLSALTGRWWGRSEGYFEAFRTSDKSIPRIRQYLSTETSQSKRGQLVEYLVLTCSINNDISGLKDLCKFVVGRFRNEKSTRISFLRNVSKHFDLLKLDDIHWKYIKELLDIASINDEMYYDQDVLNPVLEKYIQFQILRDLPVDQDLQEYITLCSRACGWGMRTLELESRADIRKCLTALIQYLSTYPLTSPSTTTSTTDVNPIDKIINSTPIHLFESIAASNRAHKNENDLSATEYPWLLEKLHTIINSNDDYSKRRIFQCVKFDTATASVLLPCPLKTYPLPKILTNSLKKSPKQLKEFMDDIIEGIITSYPAKQWNKVLQNFKTSLPQLSEKYLQKCLQVMDNEEKKLHERTSAIHVLSLLSTSQYFMQFVENFYPPEDGLYPSKLESYSPDEMRVIYEQRKIIAKSLTNLSTPSTTITALIQFCKKDYLKFTLGSLYSIGSKCPPSSQQFQEFLTDLYNRPVTVKKHAIRLRTMVSSNQEQMHFLKKFWDVETHYSIRNILFNKIFEFFIQNSSTDGTWELLESTVNSLTTDDHPFLNDLIKNVGKMPKGKLSEYLTLCLEKVDCLSSVGDKLPGATFGEVTITLLRCIDPRNINFLSASLFQDVFERYLFIFKIGNTGIQSAVISLALNYLFYYESPTTMEDINKYFRRIIGPSEESNTNSAARLQTLKYFVEQMATESFKHGVKDSIQDIFIQLQNNLRLHMDISEFLAEDLILSFTIICHKHSSCTNGGGEVMKIANDIGKLVDEIVNKFGPQLVSIFTEVLHRFITRCYTNKLAGGISTETTTISIVEGIFNSTGSINSKIVAAQLLHSLHTSSVIGIPTKRMKSTEDKYQEVRTKMSQHEDKILQIFIKYKRNPATGILALPRL